jgi:hypothetical protein
MTYGDGRWLHHYLTMKNTETEIIRGDQQNVIETLYALLLHTSATQAGFEFCIVPWGTRDFGSNLTPHGLFAANIRSLIRNMLVREQEKELHILSCISPEWVADGKRIFVRHAPTYFGQVNYQVEFARGKATIQLENSFSEKPDRLILHLPWFMDVKRIIADGKDISLGKEHVVLPVGTRSVRIEWVKREGTRTLSYNAAVEVYRSEYRHRYEEFLKTGENK